MAYFALFYEADSDFVTRRTPHREEHLKLAQDSFRRGELVLAGALAEPVDRALLIFRADSPEPARAFAENDPYVRHGVVKRWEVRPWNVVIDAIPATAASASEGR
jgi:uncharacterized protein